MRGRTGAALTIVAGLGCLALVATLRHPAVAPADAQPVAASGIDWSAARAQARADAGGRGRAIYSGFATQNRDRISRITVPVLAPSDPDLLTNLKIFPNGAGYSASASSRGMTFLITGTARVFGLGERTARTAAGVGGEAVHIERTASGLDASFTRFGAAYSISLDCSRAEDSRCSDRAYARGLVSGLVAVTPD
jgi:hypothetical protein